MRLATFNVQNLFSRNPILDADDATGAAAVFDLVAELNKLFDRPVYSDDDKTRMLQILWDLQLLSKNHSTRIVRLRVNKGPLFKMSKGQARIIPNGRGDWLGSAEMKRTIVPEGALLMTARVINETQADILAVQEVESRRTLREFNARLLRPDYDAAAGKPRGDQPFYDQIMLVEGNDERGINVGLMTRPGYSISYVRSHAHMGLPGQGGQVFSRDCAEYLVITPKKQQLWVLVNHFKSSFGNKQEKSRETRHQQALAVRAIYDRLRANRDYVAVVGDLNDHPDSEALSPLLKTDSDIQNAWNHCSFDHGNMGTFGACTEKKEQFDYILLSKPLFDKIQAGGVNRNGLWGGKSRGRWPCYEEITSKAQAASDHAAVWVDLDLA